MRIPGHRWAESIVWRVKNQFYHEDVSGLYELAALYLITIARKNVFNDGNKQTAFLIMMVFLQRNGITIEEVGSELERLTVAAATGDATSVDVEVALCHLVNRPGK
ncbi:death-on-curing (DOC) family protein [Trabulsiella guamensis ATCC 49490]|uniref:Death-on-curing (DOC) family protein n=2 Tax=Trabulsiella guamensis TaxID=158852 RepID=A0A084ZQD2_9ENTR|nr:death-on-curing (DOC) family protein [Trabulsiella guamensis ATCC 49490]